MSAPNEDDVKTLRQVEALQLAKHLEAESLLRAIFGAAPTRPSLEELRAFKASWCDQHRGVIAGLPRGVCLAVNMADGTFVTAENGLAVMDKFEAKYGEHAFAWVHEVGVPLSIGLGLWSLSSGA